MDDFTIVIPARLASTRLPDKVLLEAAGAPLLAHTWQVARQSGASRVLVATDSERVRAAAEKFGAEVFVTGSHPTGTDRLAETVTWLNLPDDHVVVNLQADEPLTPPQLLARVAANLAQRPEAEIATLCCPIENPDELHSTSAVKVVCDARNYALYFSRAPIPWDRDAFASQPPAVSPIRHYRHLGIYAYRAAFLKRFTSLAPAASEQAESLEQLRALHHGARIHVDQVAEPTPPGVDTPEDWQRVKALLEARADQ